LRSNGHEILNHTWSHANLSVVHDYATQIDTARSQLESNLRKPISFFVFPYDNWDENALAYLRKAGYMGARSGQRGVNEPEFLDPFAIKFDVYGPFGPPEYATIYAGDTLKLYVDAALENGGWAVRELHGVQDKSWYPVPLGDYRAHLDYVRSLVVQNRLYVDTPSAVIKYRFARKYCVPALRGAELSFAKNDDCVRYATELSVAVQADADAPRIVALQSGRQLETRKIGPAQFLINIDPLAGPARLTRSSGS
jgi:hypothetical protein